MFIVRLNGINNYFRLKKVERLQVVIRSYYRWKIETITARQQQKIGFIERIRLI